MHQVWFILGLTSGNSWTYLLWSGVIGDLTIAGAAFAIYKRHNCQVRGCWRIGKHPVGSSGLTTCRKHHPSLPDRAPTPADLASLHHEAAP